MGLHKTGKSGNIKLRYEKVYLIMGWGRI